MKTYLAQNQFISNSDAHVPVALGSAAVNAKPPSATAAEVIPDEPIRTVAADPISDIPEIFHWVRKLLKDDRRFVLDEGAFMAAIDEEPLFLRSAV
jgi:hypothetical protein